MKELKTKELKTKEYKRFEDIKQVRADATSKPGKDYELTRYACYLIVQ